MRLFPAILLVFALQTAALADDALPPGANKTCPVMTDTPTKATRFLDFQGQRIYFCCPDCIDIFKQDPEKYMKTLK